MPRWAFTLLTNDPDLAAAASHAGIDRIGLDLEKLGKRERQKNLGTRISEHHVADAMRVFPVVKSEARFTRVNPINAGSEEEIEALLAAGARILMLPYFRTFSEVEAFVRLVNGRALTVGLVETMSALRIVAEIVRPGLLDEVHFGFTDLGLEMGKKPPEVLRDERFLDATAAVRRLGVPFGIAGFARPGDQALPFDPAAFIAGVAKLGASRALISRSFLRPAVDAAQLAEDVEALRAFLDGLDQGRTSPSPFALAQSGFSQAHNPAKYGRFPGVS